MDLLLDKTGIFVSHTGCQIVHPSLQRVPCFGYGWGTFVAGFQLQDKTVPTAFRNPLVEGLSGWIPVDGVTQPVDPFLLSKILNGSGLAPLQM